MGNMQNKITIKCHFIPVRMAKIKKTENTTFGGNWNAHALLVGI